MRAAPIVTIPGERTLSRKERLFFRQYLANGGNPGEAALHSGIVPKGADPTDAAVAGAKLVEEIQPRLRVMMAAHGLSDRVLIGAVLEGIQATVKKVYFSEDAKAPPIIVETGVPDWRTRRFYHKLLAEMSALVGSAAPSGKDQVDEVAARRQDLAAQHRKSLSGKTDAELDAMMAEEARGRQGIRRAVS